MLAEVGEAAQTWGLRPSNASEAWKGLTLAEYRRKAVAPGARLLEYTPTGAERTKPTGTPSVRAQRAAQKLRAPKPQKPPPEQGRFACPTCGHNFGLRVTLKQHMMLSHGEKLTGPVPNLMKVKDSQPLSRPRAPAVPARPPSAPKPAGVAPKTVQNIPKPASESSKHVHLADKDLPASMDLTPSEQRQLEERESGRECPICGLGFDCCLLVLNIVKHGINL